MEQLEINAKRDAAAAKTGSSVYVPPLQLTEGQPPPISENGGLSYMSFDRDGDSGTAAATEAAFIGLHEREGKAIRERIRNAPPGPIETKWGVAFRHRAECLEYIRATGIEAPEGGVALPLRYTVYDRPSHVFVSSHAIWRDPVRESDVRSLDENSGEVQECSLYFPQVLRDARRIEEYYPGLSPDSAECMDKLGVSIAHCESKCQNFYDAAEVERVFYPEIEKLLLEFFPGATDALVYNHDVFDKDYVKEGQGNEDTAAGMKSEDQDNKDPGVNTMYADLVHNDLNDNSGRVRCRELLTTNLRNFGREQRYTEAQAEAKMSRRFMSINLAKPIETIRQYPFVLCAWPSFADQPYITDYRIYDDRVGEVTRFTYRRDHEWYWLPQQKPTEVSMLKCYDSVADGSVSRWSFHTSSVDPTAPDDAPCRKNVVLRSFVFF